MAACYQDYKSDKIKNWLVLFGLLYGLCMQLSRTGMKGVTVYAAGILVAFLLTYPFFRIGVLGAGDVKMFAVCMSVMGIQRGLYYIGCTFLMAAVLALIKMLYQRTFLKRFRYFFTYAGHVLQTAQFTLYEQENEKRRTSILHLSGPALFALLLCLGGIY